MKLIELMQQIQQTSDGIPNLQAIRAQLEALGIRPENLYQELEMTSSYVDCHRDTSIVGNLIRPHSHRFYEVIYCCSCDHMQYLMGGQRYRIQPGDVLWIPPGVSHCPVFSDAARKPFERIVLWINTEMMTALHHRWPSFPSDPVRLEYHLFRTADTDWETPIFETFQRGCLEAEKKEPGWEAALSGNTAMLITLLVRAFTNTGTPPPTEKKNLLDELLSYVAGHLHERITIADTARSLLVSESTITHLCSRMLGISFYRYVTQQRLDLAKQLMVGTASLETIAEQAGFGDYTAFYRAFRQEYGISPREYRKLSFDPSRKSL